MRKTWVLAGPGDLVAVSATGGVVAMSGASTPAAPATTATVEPGRGSRTWSPGSEHSPKGDSTTCGETDRLC
jgi:hypothetical protein